MCAKPLQPCPSLCIPMDHSSAVTIFHGILQARILEWVVMPSSRAFSQSGNWTHVSYISCIGRQVKSWYVPHTIPGISRTREGLHVPLSHGACILVKGIDNEQVDTRYTVYQVEINDVEKKNTENKNAEFRTEVRVCNFKWVWLGKSLLSNDLNPVRERPGLCRRTNRENQSAKTLRQQAAVGVRTKARRSVWLE